RLASIRRFLGLLYGLLEFLFQQVGSVFLGLHRLPENGVSPAVLLFHRLRGSFNIGESLGMRRSRVRDDRLGSRVHLQDRIAAGASEDRKSTRLNSSHVAISYAVFCL